MSPNLDQLFVYGDSLKSNIIGIINVKEENKQKLMEQFNIEGEWNEAQIKAEFLKALEKIAIDHKFNKLERLKDLLITYDDWEKESLLTNTLKKRRKYIRDFYQKQIDEIYSHLQ